VAAGAGCDAASASDAAAGCSAEASAISVSTSSVVGADVAIFHAGGSGASSGSVRPWVLSANNSPSGDNAVLFVDQHRVGEAKFADRGRDLRDLLVAVRARVSGVGDQRRAPAPNNRLG
jgi:hypothetical protein